MDDISKSNILICDDSVSNVMLLKALLESEGYCSVKTLTDPTLVLPTLEESDYDLLLLDIEMPVMDGFAVMKQVASSSLIKKMFPILVITGSKKIEVRNRALALGAQDFINKPIDQVETVLRVHNILKVYSAFKVQENAVGQLEKLVLARTQELSEANTFLIERLAMAAELRDKETGKHVLRVGQYARILAEACGMMPELCYLIEKASPLHDVGKIGIPDAILLKPGPLDKKERETMNSHAEMGAKLLRSHSSMLVSMASSIALSHHERWDGAGYPSGLMGESIPIEGRITAIADVFDALTTVRPYKEAWELEDALDYLRNNSGTHFDPALVRLFEENLDKVLDIKHSYIDEESNLIEFKQHYSSKKHMQPNYSRKPITPNSSKKPITPTINSVTENTCLERSSTDASK